MNIIDRLFGIKQKSKAFLVDSEHSRNAAETVKSLNLEVDQFSSVKQLLYTLRSKKKTCYSLGVIHESDSKYSPVIISNFIKSIDPTIKLIIYKDELELKKVTDLLVLT